MNSLIDILNQWDLVKPLSAIAVPFIYLNDSYALHSKIYELSHIGTTVNNEEQHRDVRRVLQESIFSRLNWRIIVSATILVASIVLLEDAVPYSTLASDTSQDVEGNGLITTARGILNVYAITVISSIIFFIKSRKVRVIAVVNRRTLEGERSGTDG